MLLTAFLLAATLDVPRATTPTIDGTIGADEYTSARRVPLTNGGEAFLQHDGRNLYLAIRAPRNGILSLCTPSGDDVRVLHASAALGSTTFRKGRATHDFVWTNRNTADVAARDKFLAAEHWFASASPRGSEERELQLAMDGRKTIPLTIAFLSFAPDEEQRMHLWPSSLEDGCASLELASGDTARPYSFAPATWGTVRIE